MLHSNVYRTRFLEFLKIEHPSIIFVESVNIFKQISKLGINLINSHLLKNNIELDSNIGKYYGESIENSEQKICKVVYKKETQELFYIQTCCFKNVLLEAS
ncbi:type ISP restriction/modification enzyme [Borreliella garinii]|uniref:type ISP restriction/modification enzyme n=1 Tax=Borreliella garinii TaxID=29519 RepID=UPI0032BFC4BD